MRASVDEVARTLDFGHERTEDLKLAVSEAVNNAIDHGNHREINKLVEVVFEMDEAMLAVRVTDEGTAVTEIDCSPRVLEEHNLEIGMHRGFGMSLIGALVDAYQVDRTTSGTTLTLKVFRKEQVS